MPFDVDAANPADDAIVSQFPANERASRTDIAALIEIDHTEADGKHKKVTLPELASDPANVADTGFLYTKDDSTDTELFYEDAAGNVVQVTEDGAMLGGFEATTSMLFYQDTAPSGWTKDTTTLDDHALRVVSSTAWSAGSKGNTVFSTVFGAALTVGATTLTAAQSGLPAHDHPIQFANTAGGSVAQMPPGAALAGTTTDPITNNTAQDASQPHAHTLNADLNYINVIRATKD